MLVDKILNSIDESDQKVKSALLALSTVGALVLGQQLLSNLNSVCKYLVWPRKDLAQRYGKGSWALVTGASDGLGKQYAIELAQEGFNIVLMGRNKAKTEGAALEIS